MSPDVAIDPLKNSPAVSPGENAAVPNDGGYVVQVSAERSDDKAQSSFKTLQSRHPHVLGNRSPLIRRVELGKKGIFYRTQMGLSTQSNKPSSSVLSSSPLADTAWYKKVLEY